MLKIYTINTNNTKTQKPVVRKRTQLFLKRLKTWLGQSISCYRYCVQRIIFFYRIEMVLFQFSLTNKNETLLHQLLPYCIKKKETTKQKHKMPKISK